MSAGRPPRFLLHVLLGALLLRAVALGAHALWLDEGATWSWATRATWGGTLLAEANHPPAWWAITRVWIGWFGDSEAALRMPAALLGVLSVWLGWCLALRLLDARCQPRRGGFLRDPARAPQGQRIALWFAGLLAISSFMTEYAQEARMYSLLIAEALGLALLYLRWLDDGRRRWMVLYALLAALSLYTHYFALWVLVAHGVHVVWLAYQTRKTEGRVSAWPMVAAQGAAGLLFLPWALYLVGNYQSISTGPSYEPMSRLFYVIWRVGAGPGVVVVDRARQQQGTLGTIQDEWVWVAITSVLWIVPLIAGGIALRRRPGVRAFVVCSLGVPIACCLLVFPVFQLIHERYLVFLAPWLILLAVVGARSARGATRLVLSAALCVLFGLGALAYHGASLALVPQGKPAGRIGNQQILSHHVIAPDDALTWMHGGHAYGKEPWRQAQAFVEQHSQPGDLVLLHPHYLHLVWDYYDRGRLARRLLPQKLLTAKALDAAHGEALAAATRVFLVLAHEETKHPDDYVAPLRDALVARWPLGADTPVFQVTRPIWFDRSWGVRVAVFNRRQE